MMRRLMMAALLGAFALPALTAEAGGCRRSSCAPACNDCGYSVAYVDKVVTGYRAEARCKEVEVVVNRVVSKVVPETVKCTVMEPVYTQEKRQGTTWECVTKQVEYTYSVCVPVMTQEKRQQTYWTCVPEEVTVQVPVCRMVSVPCVDPCNGCCYTSCKMVTEWQTCKKVVMRQVAQTREVLVNVCSYTTEQKTGTRLVVERVAKPVEYTVNVCSYRAVEKESVVNRVVCETVQEKVKVQQNYCEMVPYTYTVKVPVRVPCAPAPCAPVACCN